MGGLVALVGGKRKLTLLSIQTVFEELSRQGEWPLL